MLDLLLDAKRVAAILNISPKSVFRLAANGELRSVRWGRTVRFEQGAVEEFIGQRRRGPKDEADRPPDERRPGLAPPVPAFPSDNLR